MEGEEQEEQFREQRHSSELVCFDNGKKAKPIFIMAKGPNPIMRMAKLQISRRKTGPTSSCEVEHPLVARVPRRRTFQVIELCQSKSKQPVSVLSTA
jgi:hypothetical protein